MFIRTRPAGVPVEGRSRRTWVLVITSRTDLGASVTELEWTVNAYGLSFAVLLMTAAGLPGQLAE